MASRKPVEERCLWNWPRISGLRVVYVCSRLSEQVLTESLPGGPELTRCHGLQASIGRRSRQWGRRDVAERIGRSHSPFKPLPVRRHGRNKPVNISDPQKGKEQEGLGEHLGRISGRQSAIASLQCENMANPPECTEGEFTSTVQDERESNIRVASRRRMSLLENGAGEFTPTLAEPGQGR